MTVWLAALAALIGVGLTYGFTINRTVTVAWNWTPPTGDYITNYNFNIRTSTDPSTPLPWPLLLVVSGQLTATFAVTNSSQFFYVTVSDPRSSPTNYVFESDPSNVLAVRSLPTGTVIIQSGH